MAMFIDELLVNLGFDTDTSGANRFNASLNNVLGTVGKLTSAFVVAGGVVGGFLGKSMTDTASQFEQFETQLTTITGSSEKAKESLEWISEFAKKTPFELDGVTAAFVKLKAYGFDPTTGLLQDLGDAAGGLGKDIMVGVEAIADAVNGENERLKEAFNIKARVDTTTNTTAYTYTDTATGEQAIKEVTTGAKDEIEAALREIIQTNYAGGMDAMSSTWSGMTSNMLDTWTAVQNKIMGAGLFDRMKTGLKTVMDTVNDNEQAIDDWAESIGGKLVVAYDWLERTLFDVWDGALWTRDALKSLSDAIGLTEHRGKILAGVLGLLAANFAGLAALKTVSAVMSLASGFMLLFSPLALIGVAIAGVLLVMQDIYGFMNGQDSLIGSLIGDYPILNEVIAIAYQLVDAIKAIWTDNEQTFKELWAAIGDLFTAFKPLISLLIDILPPIFSVLLQVALVVIQAIALAVGLIVDSFTSAVESITAIWNGLWSVLSFVFDGFFDYVVNKIQAVLGMVTGLISAVKSIADGDIVEGIKIGASSLWNGAKQFISNGEPEDSSGLMAAIGNGAGAAYNVGKRFSDINQNSQRAGMSAIDYSGRHVSNNINESTVTQTINVASASEAAIIANRTAQGSRQQTNGYQ